MLILLLLLWLFKNRFKHRRYKTYTKAAANPSCKYRKKPSWAVYKIIHFKAIMPHVGCRKLAATFNRQFGHRETVSKTWVNYTVKKHQHEILLLRKRLKNKKPHPTNINKAWGIDLTGKFDKSKNNLHILGIVDHGSRANLCLRAIHSKATIHLLKIIFDSIEKYGKPQSIRTDNETIFKSRLFKFSLWLLRIRHQRTDLGCPWQNGRIERFFGTLKEKLNQVVVDDITLQNHHLKDFRFWFNHVRTHQNIDDRTPAEVWSGKGHKRQAYFYSSWGGLLTGFWHPPDT